MKTKLILAKLYFRLTNGGLHRHGWIGCVACICPESHSLIIEEDLLCEYLARNTGSIEIFQALKNFFWIPSLGDVYSQWLVSKEWVYKGDWVGVSREGEGKQERVNGGEHLKKEVLYGAKAAERSGGQSNKGGKIHRIR